MDWMQIAQIAGWVLLGVAVLYLISKYYQTQADFTYMTQNDQGFKQALKGRGILLDPEEAIVRGPSAPKIEFVALDPATGQRKMVALLDQRSGRVNLRPQYCVPMPFPATTEEGHQVVCTARVQFSLNRDKMFFVYQVQDFATALETRIQSAIRAEVGRRTDERLRAGLREVEQGALRTLRQAEEEGDEAHEMGFALGAKFHGVSFDFSKNARAFAAAGDRAVVADGKAVTGALQSTGVARAGALAVDPGEIDAIADQFTEPRRSPASTAAYLALAEMQTRQNIAEALAASGQLIVLTPQELGLFGANAPQEALARRSAARTQQGAPNGGVHHPEQRL
jgi:hypothetical protein